MTTILRIIFLAFVAQHASAQDAAGTLTLSLEGEEQHFVLIQGAEGANPGSRYSRVGQDVVMTVVGVLGDEPLEPDHAPATVELRFTIDATGPKVRSGSVLSYSTTDAEGMPMTRGGTAEIAIDSLTTEEDRVTASGTFTAELPPDQVSDASEVEGAFTTEVMSREALDP